MYVESNKCFIYDNKVWKRWEERERERESRTGTYIIFKDNNAADSLKRARAHTGGEVKRRKSNEAMSQPRSIGTVFFQ